MCEDIHKQKLQQIRKIARAGSSAYFTEPTVRDAVIAVLKALDEIVTICDDE